MSEGGTNATQQPVVVYDGDCAFCRRRAASIARRDRDGLFELVPRQQDGLEERFPALADGDFDTGMRLVHTDGAISVGADAVYEIARRLPRTRLIAWVYRVPLVHGLCRAIYAWIARNRHRLARDCDEGCEIRRPETGQGAG